MVASSTPVAAIFLFRRLPKRYMRTVLISFNEFSCFNLNRADFKLGSFADGLCLNIPGTGNEVKTPPL